MVEKSNELIPTGDKEPVPGIGMAGVVMCPFGFQKSPCLKGGCELWVELNTGGRKVARCSLAWIPLLQCETNGNLNILNRAMLGPIPGAEPPGKIIK